MLYSLLLAALNALLSAFGTYLLRLPGIDLTPLFIIILARSGENVFLAAIILTLSYAAVKPDRFAWAWLLFVSTLATGLLATFVESALLLVLLFHAIHVVVSLAIGTFGASRGHLLYIGVNLALNLVGARLL